MEETGYDLDGQLNEEDFIELTLEGKRQAGAGALGRGLMGQAGAGAHAKGGACLGVCSKPTGRLEAGRCLCQKPACVGV